MKWMKMEKISEKIAFLSFWNSTEQSEQDKLSSIRWHKDSI